MNNYMKKKKENLLFENINYIDINRYHCEKKKENCILDNPYIWENKIELTKNSNYKEEATHAKQNVANSNYMKDIGTESCNKCFIKREKERETETTNFRNKLNFFNKNILSKVIDDLWKTLNLEEENALDMFNDKIYRTFTLSEKKKFQNHILIPFISYADNIDEIKNVFFEKNVLLKNKFDKNIYELKRIANENDLCFMVNNNIENGLTEEKQMLITSKNKFYKIMNNIIIDENLFDSDKDNIVLKTILQILESKGRSDLNKEQHFFLKDYNFKDLNSNIRKPNDLNKIYYSIKKKISEKEKNTPLLREDYEIIQKENLINDLIHNTIIHFSENTKRGKVDNIIEKENDINLSKYKNTKKTHKYLQTYKKRESYDPLHVLKLFLDKDSNILDYKTFLDDLSSCTFQPNIHKYIEKEISNLNKRRVEVEEKDNKKVEFEVDKIFNNENGIINSQVYEYIYKTLNEPCNIEKNTDIMKHLKLFYLYYNTNANKNCRSKKIFYEKASHRSLRNSAHNGYTSNIEDIKIEKKKKVKSVNSKNAWSNGLRGGYIRNPFDFSLVEKNDKLYELEKEHRVRQIDWGKEIRLSGRRLNTKVISNLDLVKSVAKSSTTYVEEQPTIIVRKNFLSKDEYKKDENKQERLSSHKENGNDTTNAINRKTIFTIPTPIKTHKYNRSIRIKNELDNFEKLTSFAPLKVIAVKKKNTLENIKKELLSLPESVHFIYK